MDAGNRARNAPNRQRALARLAERQYGLISRAQARGLGVTSSAIQRRVAAGRWERLHLGVYRLTGAPPSWEQRLMAACLACEGAVASHRSAARLWSFPGLEDHALELSIPPPRRLLLPGVIVHRPRQLMPRDRASRRHIPVTSPTRTLFDLALVVRADLLEEALDDALRRGLTSLRRLRAAVDGRRAPRALRALLDERDPGRAPAESALETRLARALRDAGLPLPAHQYVVRDDHGRFVARVDLAYPAARVAIEADGYRHHAGRARFEHDRARGNALTALGWRVLHVTWRDLERDARAVAVRVAELLPARGPAERDLPAR